MPDELTAEERLDPAGPPDVVQDAPPAGALEPSGRAPRRPSWLRAALWSLVVLAAGVTLGGAAYRVERSTVPSPSATRTGDGWVIAAREQRGISGISLSGSHLIWQDGAIIEYLDLDRGKVLALGPGPGMRTTWDPAIGDRYAIWFEAERPMSLAARAVAYDTKTGRRWVRTVVGSIGSYPAISGDLAVWGSAVSLGHQAVWGVRIAGGESPFQVAPGSGAPVVSGDLVVWAHGWTGPFTAKEIRTGVSWHAADALAQGKLTGLALAGRTLVWGQGSAAEASGVVVACDVDGGATRTVASAVTGLSGPSFDGRTIVWGEGTATGGRVMARTANGGAPYVIARVAGEVTELAVSGDRVAWIEHRTTGYVIVVRTLPAPGSVAS